MKDSFLRLRITPEMRQYLEELYGKYKNDEEIDSLSDVVRMIINRFRESPYGEI